MRFAVLLVLLAACDLQPPPKKRGVAGSGSSPPPPADTIDAATAQLVAPPDAGVVVVAVVDAGEARAPGDAGEPSKECTDVAVHIAEKVIAQIADPAQKAALEQDRTTLVRRAAVTCTRDNWTEATRKCFLAASTKEQLEACGKALQAP